ncbi:MAG: phosphoglycolate phosphatase [Ignisphaera sp.]
MNNNVEKKLLESLKDGRPSAIFIDIDGVLTIERGSYVIDLELIELLRKVMEYNIPVCLVSGNAYPTVLTLQRYLGLSPIFIAENGCVIQLHKELIKICRENLDPLVDEIEKEFHLKRSASNLYRLCDRAFHVPDDVKSNPSKARELEKNIMEKYPSIYALYTGYVLHIYPRYCSKSSAIRIVAEKMGLDLEKAIAIGDSVTDVDMIKTVGIGVAVGDADEEAKRDAKIVLPFKASQSTKYLISILLKRISQIRE